MTLPASVGQSDTFGKAYFSRSFDLILSPYEVWQNGEQIVEGYILCIGNREGRNGIFTIMPTSSTNPLIAAPQDDIVVDGRQFCELIGNKLRVELPGKKVLWITARRIS